MIFRPLELLGAFCIEPEPIIDSRGEFARVFCEEEHKKLGLQTNWTQWNLSRSSKVGTIRGLHFQKPPAAEAKLVRCTHGAIFDVIVDLRRESDTFAKWYGVRLDQENGSMMYVPAGFAHGFQSLTDNVEMLYFHSCNYSPKYETGIRWNDPQLDICWPLALTSISERDAQLKSLSDLEPIDL